MLKTSWKDKVTNASVFWKTEGRKMHVEYHGNEKTDDKQQTDLRQQRRERNVVTFG